MKIDLNRIDIRARGVNVSVNWKILHFDVVNASMAAAFQVSNFFFHKEKRYIIYMRYARVQIANQNHSNLDWKSNEIEAIVIVYKYILWWWHIFNYYLWSMDLVEKSMIHSFETLWTIFDRKCACVCCCVAGTNMGYVNFYSCLVCLLIVHFMNISLLSYHL